MSGAQERFQGQRCRLEGQELTDDIWHLDLDRTPRGSTQREKRSDPIVTNPEWCPELRPESHLAKVMTLARVRNHWSPRGVDCDGLWGFWPTVGFLGS